MILQPEIFENPESYTNNQIMSIAKPDKGSEPKVEKNQDKGSEFKV